MKYTFWVKNDKVEDTKSLVRQHKSLRFRGNPIKGTHSTEFCLEGDVEDFNSLNSMLESHKETGTEEGFTEQLGFPGRFKHLFNKFGTSKHV